MNGETFVCNLLLMLCKLNRVLIMSNKRKIRRFFLVSLLIVVHSGCAVYAKHYLDDTYGSPEVREHLVTASSDQPEYHRDVKSIIDNRCVVCHGCYDAPCQLKLSSFEGIDRGANETKVYDGRRILAADPTRLFIDAKNTEQWRDKDFFPVLNERNQDPESNLMGSVLYRMLTLKNTHPLSGEKNYLLVLRWVLNEPSSVLRLRCLMVLREIIHYGECPMVYLS